MRGPDFIIIGAMKCGTTTLAAQLGAQPGLFLTEPKEPNFFSDDARYNRGLDWYEDLFASAAPGVRKGEASTHYTKRPDYPQTLERMQRVLPELKLIYMIRNPIERLVSHYIHEWSQAVLSCSLDAAVDTHGPLVDYGRFGWQLEPFIEAYGRSSILLTSLELLKQDPTRELTRIARHIGHSAPVRWQEEHAAENVSAERVRRLPMHELLVDNPVATALRRSLVPKTIRTQIRTARMMKERPSLSQDLQVRLQARFAADREILARHFPGDPSLTLAYPFLTP